MDDLNRELVTATLEGDPHALNSVLERCIPRLEAYVRIRMGRVLRARESTADIVQSACLEALRGLEGYRYRGESLFRKHLFEAAYRKIVDRARYHGAAKRDPRREARIPDDSAESSNASVLHCYRTFCTPSRHAVAHEAMEQVEQALDDLPEDYRTVINLAKVVGLSHAEIAQEMGRKEGAVRVLLYRGLCRLRELLNRKNTETRKDN